MDVKVVSRVIFIFIFLGFLNASASTKDVTLVTEDGTKKCTTNLHTCKVKLGDNLFHRGEKGDNGKQGPKGLKGEKGELGQPGTPGATGLKGDTGDPGSPGVPGLTGSKGDKGDQGPTGTPGRDGPPGVQGLMGPIGIKGDGGLPGPKAEKGATGSAGPVGPPGLPGTPGVCPCKRAPLDDLYASEADEFGLKKKPADVTCKSAPADVESGIYFMGPTYQEFEVYCNMTSKETCIRGEAKTRELTYDLEKGPFWLSEAGIEIMEIYNLTTEQISWLQLSSSYVRQKLKYHCLDSVPYPKFNHSSSVQLLTWNDVVIEPFPTTKTPLIYSVPADTDGCTEGSSDWQSTIIELQSLKTHRLPITDLRILDVRGDHQKMFIEHIELCFG